MPSGNNPQQPQEKTEKNAFSAVPASLWKRLFAGIYDLLILLAIYMAATALLLIPLEAMGFKENLGQYPAYQILLLLLTLLFYVGFWRYGGQTLGMQAWRLRIVNEQGQTISWRQGIIRWLWMLVSFIMLGQGFWWVLWDKEKRSWHDIRSRSRVVQLTKP